MLEIRRVATPEDVTKVQGLLRGYYRWIGGLGVDICYQGLAEEGNVKLQRAAAVFFGYLALVLGLPLLGWGWDLTGFCSLWPRPAFLAIGAAFALASGWQAYEDPEGVTGSRGQEAKLVRRQEVVRITIELAYYGALLVLPAADRYGLYAFSAGPWARGAGVVLYGLGSALVFWSGLALGRLYSGGVTIQRDHRLVASGPYAVIRHPRYLGGLFLVGGAALVFRSWIGLALTALFLGLYLFRIHDEEALMRREFGAEWESYCRRTWRLLPYIY